MAFPMFVYASSMSCRQDLVCVVDQVPDIEALVFLSPLDALATPQIVILQDEEGGAAFRSSSRVWMLPSDAAQRGIGSTTEE